MLGLLSIGVAVMLGVACRVSAVAGVLMLAMMWFAEYPLAQHLSTGGRVSRRARSWTTTSSPRSRLVAVAATFAGETWGLGRVWARLPFVRQHHWAR